MSTAEEKKKARLIKSVAALVRKGAKGKHPAIAASFADTFYAYVPPDDILDRGPAELAGAVLSIWSFGQNRKPGKTLVRAINPREKKDGWTTAHTVIEIVNDDMPFLVDSVANALSRQGLTVHLVIHPIVKTLRNKSGALTRLLDPESRDLTATTESFMHVEIDEQGDPQALKKIVADLKQVLADVRAAVEDWPHMRAEIAKVLVELDAAPPPLPPEELDEGRQFLRWLDDGHFTFLGYRDYTFPHGKRKTRLDIVPGSGLGILRKDDARVFEGVRNLASLPPEVDAFVQQPKLLLIAKGNRRATVHRPVHLDAIGVKQFDEHGRVTGERLFVGLFTSVAYNRSPRFIPLLRRKLDQTIEAAGLHPNSHDGKALMHILETFPRDELFQIGNEELLEISTGILHLQERQRTALFVRRDPFERFVSCLVFVPRDRHDTNLRKRIQFILENAYQGECQTFDTQLDQHSVLARVHFMIRTTPGEIPAVNASEIEARITNAARSWSDKLQEALVKDRGEEKGLALNEDYANAFSAAYQETFDASVAIEDIDVIQRMFETGLIGVNLLRRPDQGAREVRFKIYSMAIQVTLSDALPVLENLGFRVINETPYRVSAKGHDTVWVHDFGLIRRDGKDIELETIRDAFHQAFLEVWAGRMEDDAFNRLVVMAGLTWRQVVILRAYAKYLRQAQIPFSQAYMEDTLSTHPDIARLIVNLFETRFDPASGKDAEQKANGVRGAISRALDDVASADEDRILRRFLNMVESTLRTNFYQTDRSGAVKRYVSFKLDSQAVDELPLPRPMVEIFVYSPSIEGVHLRFGKVARGGLRWSDRREDFRTEVLGLVKAQQVKNAVIVPVGSKGGFVVKRPPESGEREAVLNEGIACYKTFISGLLDLTDNLKGARVVPPKGVVRKDEDDPYLVVAADKGTATFSDIANGVAAQYGFWLDDAFASGGSAGYDHKKMGITARGAWESVKRHFREIGKNIQEEDFTVVGVGDMSGDVFGNGMLLSKHIRLLAAFNHLHVFVDPNPDAVKSWQERKRLFDLPRSTWADYDAKVMSKGGAIYERRAKTIKLTPEIRKLAGFDKDSVTPNELIRALLRHPAELLWFGGIGTYVKSRDESDAEVGDRANDAIRIDGTEVGAQVIGEGANLGVTQLGRIEYALGGGRLNTDSVDNSAGVDCSDHEVNIKILTGVVEQANKLSRKQRNSLLVKMTDEVAELVLRDNYLQTGALSVTQHIGVRLTDRLANFIRALERAGRLNRAVEDLPDDETIADRKSDKVGLARPELCILISYAKIVLYDQLLESDFPDDRYMVEDLIRYFPGPLQKKYSKQIEQHRLRREIIATVATNSIVNRAGITFAHEMIQQSGLEACDVARAYTIARTVYELRDIWERIEALDNKVPADVQYEMTVETGRLINRATSWFLRVGPHPLDIAKLNDAYGPGVAEIARRLDDFEPQSIQKHRKARANAFVERGVPRDIAARVADLRDLSSACDIVRVAGETKSTVERAARVYFGLGRRFGLDLLRRAATVITIDTHWDKQATAAIIDDLYTLQYDFTARVLAGGSKADATKAIDAWCEARDKAVASTLQLVDELKATPKVDLAMLAVANRQLRALAIG